MDYFSSNGFILYDSSLLMLNKKIKVALAVAMLSHVVGTIVDHNYEVE